MPPARHTLSDARLVAAALLVLATAVAHPAGAVDRYAVQGGTILTDCTSIADPCGSIGRAVFFAVPGDRVLVAAGTWFGGGVKDDVEVSGEWNTGFRSVSLPSSIVPLVSTSPRYSKGAVVEVRSASNGLIPTSTSSRSSRCRAKPGTSPRSRLSVPVSSPPPL